jgi:hypothetical protein
MREFKHNIFTDIDEIEPLSKILDLQEKKILETVNPKNLDKAKLLINIYSISHTPFEILKNSVNFETCKIEIIKFIKQRETNLQKVVLGL